MAQRIPTQHEPAMDAQQLRQAALDHLFVPMREPSEMAEKGEPRIIVEGHGVMVTDINGKEYIDCLAGLWLKNIGHGRREVADAAYQQMLKLTYTPMGTTTVPTIQLSEKLAQITPGSLSRTFFVSGGSEAVETAVKLARAYHRRNGEGGRYKIISRKFSYHGATGVATWLGGNPVYARQDFEPAYPGMVYAPQPLPYRCELGGRTPSECAVKCARAVEELILFHGPETVCAVIAEPIAVPAGPAVPGDEYWPMLREICTKYGALLIDDEVICGFGRTGKMFGIEHWGVEPDIMTVAKGLTSGYLPIGAAIVSKRVADSFVGNEKVMFRHLITFGGHPVSAAAALKNIEILEQEKLVQNSATMGEYLLEQLQDIKERHPIVGDARGRGLLACLELVKDRGTREHWPAEAALGKRLTQKFIDRGLMLRPPGDSISLSPPLCINRSEIDEICHVMDRSLGELEQELGVRK
ncbi:MAG: aspartate aminotransferase family protein [Chloroflexi bacterium]|nr:aspartate aminotransferase family protein [Chloroflexota bacterium]